MLCDELPYRVSSGYPDPLGLRYNRAGDRYLEEGPNLTLFDSEIGDPLDEELEEPTDEELRNFDFEDTDDEDDDDEFSMDEEDVEEELFYDDMEIDEEL